MVIKQFIYGNLILNLYLTIIFHFINDKTVKILLHIKIHVKIIFQIAKILIIIILTAITIKILILILKILIIIAQIIILIPILIIKIHLNVKIIIINVIIIIINKIIKIINLIAVIINLINQKTKFIQHSYLKKYVLNVMNIIHLIYVTVNLQLLFPTTQPILPTLNPTNSLLPNITNILTKFLLKNNLKYNMFLKFHKDLIILFVLKVQLMKLLNHQLMKKILILIKVLMIVLKKKIHFIVFLHLTKYLF